MPTVAAAGYPTGPEAPPAVPLDVPGGDYQRIQATPDAFGAQVGQSMSALGRVLTTSADEFRQVAMERQQLHNNVVSDKAINDFNDKANNLLYGDPNAPPGSAEAKGYYGLRGQDAIDAYPKMRDALQTSREQMRGQLENPMQQLNFDKETRRQMSLEMGRAGSHYDQQYDVFQTNTNKAGADLSRQKMDQAALANDDLAFNKAVASTMDWEMKQLQARGAANDPNEVAAMQGRVRSDAVNRRIQAYIGTNTTESLGNAARVLDEESLPGGALSAADAAKYRTVLSEYKVASAIERARNPGAGGALNIPTGPIPDAISTAAPQAGVSNRLAMGTASIESGFGQSPDRPGSQYKGVFQLGDKEWEQMGGGDRNDRQLQIDHGLRLLAQRKTELAQSLGREPADWEVYLAHQQGVAGATALIQNPNMTAGQAVTQAGGAPVNISGNGGNPNAPASAFTAHWQQTFEQHANRATPSPGAPAATTTTPTTGTPIAIGDSIARGFQRFGGAGGTGKDLDASDTTVHASGGRSPSTILTYLKSQPDGSLSGQPVVLSTGVSNGPTQINLVPEQLAELKRMGAGPISVVGVGTKAGEEGGNHYDLNKYNAQIEQAAKAAGATFLGGLPAVVHPAASYYTGAMPKPAPAAPAAKPQAATAASGIYVDSSGTQIQNIGGIWINLATGKPHVTE